MIYLVDDIESLFDEILNELETKKQLKSNEVKQKVAATFPEVKVPESKPNNHLVYHSKKGRSETLNFLLEREVSIMYI